MRPSLTVRKEHMTRLDTFVDAAFAFAITMMVISLDSIPKSPEALFELSKDIPAFICSGLLIATIWKRHSNWSKTFGLETNMTTSLSVVLVLLVLIFVYPIKLLFMGLFTWISYGFLSPGFEIHSFHSLSWLFVYFSLGLMSLSSIFWGFYHCTLKERHSLNLNENEVAFCEHKQKTSLGLTFIAALTIVLALSVPSQWVPYVGCTYLLEPVMLALIRRLESKRNM